MARRARRPNLKSVAAEILKVEKQLTALRGQVLPKGRKIIDLKLKQLRGMKKKMPACPKNWGNWPPPKPKPRKK